MIFRKKDIVGLDIGSKHIKIVQLKDVKGKYQLERLGISTLEPELIVDGSILDSSRVIEAIKGLITNTNIKVKDAALSLSGHSSVIIKRVSFQQMSEDELSESIKFEAEQYIPFDIEDVNLDFQILGPGDKENMMDVLIVAAKKDKINEYVTVAKGAGLNPLIVDVDAFALENMYELNYEMKTDENVALVNVGASMININILKGGISVFTRDSAVGGNLHTEALQKEFTISYANAEKLKQEGKMEGISQEDMKAVLVSTSEDIIAEISRSFDYFRDSTNLQDINEVILLWWGALTTGFMTLLTERFGINTTMAESLKNITVPDSFDKDYLKKVEPIISVAVGLALRRTGDK